ncbi:MAG TPA: glycosyl hydrolase family 28-related protein [Longimicrobium sp.]|jgi:hypothetical protein
MSGHENGAPGRSTARRGAMAAAALLLAGGAGWMASGLPRIAAAAESGAPVVGFASAAGSAPESEAAAVVTVRLSEASAQRVTVRYAVSGGTAHAVPHGSGQDYTLAAGTLTFPAGTTTRTIRIAVANDGINETDETVSVQLSSPAGAALGRNAVYTHTIVDDDRRALVSVRDFGARGDGTADDTPAIQRAIESVYARGGGVIVFPRGTYRVTSVNIREGITYEGFDAVITRPPMQGKWARSFTTERVPYSGDADSRPLIIRGLTFDGNSAAQGPYQQHQLEQAHLVFLYGEPSHRGRLRAVVEDCHFRNGVADGVSVSTNVAAKVYNCDAVDVFRGGFVLTGGHSRADVHTFTTRGTRDPTGIDVEVDGRGFGNTLKVEVNLTRLRLLNGDFDVGVHEGSTVTGQDIVAKAPFFLYAENSTVRIRDCDFEVGYPDSFGNRIVYPKDVTFTDCTFTTRERVAGEANRGMRIADVYWNFDWAQGPRRTRQSLTFNNCRFVVGEDVEPADAVYVASTTIDDPAHANVVTINGGTIGPGFDAVFAPVCTRCVRNP